MSLRLTVLGSAGTHPGVARMCSGYLLRTATTAVLVDAGNGSTANLQRYLRLDALDAIIISHRHIDHLTDLVGMFYALRYGAPPRAPLTVYAPAQVEATLADLLSSDSAHQIADVFAFHEIAGGDTVTCGEMTVSFADAVHTVPAVSMRIEVAGRTVVYSGDTAANPALVELARSADLFVCEATWTGSATDYPDGIHLTARGAGEHAAAAGVTTLVLTHLAGHTDPARAVAEAATAFFGGIETAEDLTTYVIN